MVGQNYLTGMFPHITHLFAQHQLTLPHSHYHQAPSNRSHEHRSTTTLQAKVRKESSINSIKADNHG